MYTRIYYTHIHLGTKNVAKILKKVCVGTAAQRGKTWFPELADKSKYLFTLALFKLVIGKSTKTDIYWCMKNAGGNPGILRARVLNISKHYQVLFLHFCIINRPRLIQVIHDNCHESSPCKQSGCSPSKTILVSVSAIEVFEKALRQTQIFCYAESYCRVSTSASYLCKFYVDSHSQ